MDIATKRNEKRMSIHSMIRMRSGSRGAMMAFLVFLLMFGCPFLIPAQADILDVYQSDGILRDLIVLEGDTIAINTGSSPPEFFVDASPIGYIYKGRVVDGAAVFDFNDVFIDNYLPLSLEIGRW